MEKKSLFNIFRLLDVIRDRLVRIVKLFSSGTSNPLFPFTDVKIKSLKSHMMCLGTLTLLKTELWQLSSLEIFSVFSYPGQGPSC